MRLVYFKKDTFPSVFNKHPIYPIYHFFGFASKRACFWPSFDVFDFVGPKSSSDTQGRLVGATGFSRAKVYNKNGRAPGHLLLLNEFQKRLKSRSLIGQKNQKAGFQTLLELVR